MFGVHVHIRDDMYHDMMKWSMPYRQYITGLSARKVPMHMVPFFSLENVQTLRLTGIQVMVDDVERLLRYLPHLKSLNLSTIVSTTDDLNVPLRLRYRALDMCLLPSSLESVVLRFSTSRVRVRVLPNMKNLHIHCKGDCFVLLEDLGRLESIYVYGSIILTDGCPKSTTLKRATFESPEMLLYGHFMDILPQRMESLSLLLPLSFIIWDYDKHIDDLRIHARMVFFRTNVLPRRITIFTKVLLAPRDILHDVWDVQTSPTHSTNPHTMSKPREDSLANTFIVEEYISLSPNE